MVKSLEELRTIVWNLLLWTPDPEKRAIYRKVYEDLCSV